MPKLIMGTGKGWGAAKAKRSVKSEPKFKAVLPGNFKKPKGKNPKKAVAKMSY